LIALPAHVCAEPTTNSAGGNGPAEVVTGSREDDGSATTQQLARADQLQEDGDWQGALTWHRILDAIHRLQAKAPAEGEKVH